MDIQEYFEYCEQNNFKSRGHIILEQIKSINENFGYIDSSLFHKISDFDKGTASNWFGSWNSAMKAAGLDPNKQYNVDESELLHHLNQLNDEYGVVTQNLMAERGDYSYSLYEHVFGSWNNALDEAGIEPFRRRNVSKKLLISELKRLEKEYGKVTIEIVKNHSKFSQDIFYRRFGSFTKALEKSDIEKNQCNYTQKDLILEMKRLKKEHGKVTPDIMRNHGIFSASEYRTAFSSWSEAKKEAGLEINPRPKLSDIEILKDLCNVYREKGKLSQSIYDGNGAFSHTTVQNRFGSWSKAKSLVKNVIEENLEVQKVIKELKEGGEA